MKDTGVVRRIDELGRIVIPKEIRRLKRMKEGTPVEIFVNNENEVVIRKYSQLLNLKSFAEDVSHTLADMTESSVLICDLDMVISTADCSKSQFINKTISKDIEKIILERRGYIFNKKDGGKIISLISDDDHEYSTQIVVPVISQGDVCGGIILFRTEGEFSITEVKIAQSLALFLCKQMD